MRKTTTTTNSQKKSRLCVLRSRRLSRSRRSSALFSALWGGTSKYWYAIDVTTPEWDSKPEDFGAVRYATQLLLEGKTIVIYDVEDEERRWELTLRKVLKGIGMAISRSYSITRNVDEILQLSLFGEVIYG